MAPLVSNLTCNHSAGADPGGVGVLGVRTPKLHKEFLNRFSLEIKSEILKGGQVKCHVCKLAVIKSRKP